MFPSNPIIKIDDHPGIEILKNHQIENSLIFLPGIRIVGLLRQAECLSQYALQIFGDISNSSTFLFRRVDNLNSRTKSLENKFLNIINSFKERTNKKIDIKNIKFNKKKIKNI